MQVSRSATRCSTRADHLIRDEERFQQAVEEALLGDVLLLLEAGEEEVDLGLEGGAGAVLVELAEERVAHVFEDLHAVEAGGEHLHEGGLADPDGAVHGQVVERERAALQG